jgi:hypothetical protein
MRYELEIEDVGHIVVQDLCWFYSNGELSKKELKAIETLLKLYMTEREFNDWQATGVYA